MRIYEVKASDGKIYSVEAPEGTTEGQLFAFVASQTGMRPDQMSMATVRAELADGRVLEFPHGTDASVIQATVKKMIAAEQPQPTSGVGGVGVLSLAVVVIVGIGIAFYLERKISKMLNTKAQRILLAIAACSFGFGLIGLLNELIVVPQSGLIIKYQEIYKHIFFNIFAIPSSIGLVIWFLKRSETPSKLQGRPNEPLYAQALHEIDGGRRVDGLWARCFSDASGDEKVAKANYIKIRVKQLQQQGD